MSLLPKTTSSARVQEIIDSATGYGWIPSSELNDEIIAALDRARSDARCLERIARQRRKAVHYLTWLTKWRADYAARRAEIAARHAEVAARQRQRVAEVVEPLSG